MGTVPDLTAKLEDGTFNAVFSLLYPDEEAGHARTSRRYLSLMNAFTNRYGPGEGAILVSTPGRTEIGGNHTDHQHGCVLAGSVTMDIVAVAAPNGLDRARILSDGYPELDVPLDNPAPNPDDYNESRALVRGVAAQFAALGHEVRGFDACLHSTVLKGSGLSSSAAFEVLLGTVCNHLFAGGALSPVDIAKIGRYAENVYFGKPSGLMDQLACAVGGVLAIDFCDIDAPGIEKIEYDFAARGYALCIIDSGADHSAMTDEYSPIPREMRAVAEFFGHSYLREVSKDEVIRQLGALRQETGDRAVLRALHFFGDSGRAVAEAAALREDRLDDFLALVNRSGRSSGEYLQNIHPGGSSSHQEVGLALALCDEFLGGRGAYRVHGGGFAGTVQAFVPVDLVAGFSRSIDAALGQGSCHVLQIRNAGSIRIG